MNGPMSNDDSRTTVMQTCECTCSDKEIGYMCNKMMKVPILEIQERRLSCLMKGERFTSMHGDSQIAQPGMNMGQDRQMRMVGANGGNQFRQYAGQNVGNQNGYNAVQNIGNQVVRNAIHNQGVQNVRNQNGIIVVPGITNRSNGNVDQEKGCAYLQTQLLIAQRRSRNSILQAESWILMAICRDLDEIEEVNAINCLVQNFEIKFLKEAAKFVRDFQSLAKEADESLAKHKALELEIERLLRAVVSQDIMSIVQNNSVRNTSNLQTKLEQCKYDKTSYDKAYDDMQQKIKRLQAQLGDQKGKSKDTQCVSNTLDLLYQNLENENVELEFQVLNYAKENAHLKTTYKSLFDSIKVTRAQTKAIIDSLQDKLHDTIYENAKLRAQLFDKVSEQKDTNKVTSVNTQFSKQLILGKPPSSSKPKLYSITPFPKSTVIPKVSKSNALSKPVTSNSAPSSRESNVVNNERVIALGIFRINPFKASRVDNFCNIRQFLEF
ncbi:hypothetical protein Tco_0755189 [Tanacetum coccineum]